MPPCHITSDLGDTTEEEEVQRDPRASSSSLLEEAQVRYAFSIFYILGDYCTSTTSTVMSLLCKDICEDFGQTK